MVYFQYTPRAPEQNPDNTTQAPPHRPTKPATQPDRGRDRAPTRGATPVNATTQTAPADFDGYLAISLMEGYPPFLYRLDRVQIGRDTPTACEDCGKQQTEQPAEPFYRWVELHETGWPLHLGVCRTCVVGIYWDKRYADNELASGVGDRMHIYSPIDPVTRDRNARS